MPMPRAYSQVSAFNWRAWSNSWRTISAPSAATAQNQEDQAAIPHTAHSIAEGGDHDLQGLEHDRGFLPHLHTVARFHLTLVAQKVFSADSSHGCLTFEPITFAEHRQMVTHGAEGQCPKLCLTRPVISAPVDCQRQQLR